MADVIDELAIKILADDRFSLIGQRILVTLDRLEKGFDDLNSASKAHSQEIKAVAESQKELADALDDSTGKQSKNTKAKKDGEKQTKKNAKAQKENKKETEKNTRALADNEKQVRKTERAVKGLVDTVTGFTRVFASITTLIIAGSGLDRLAEQASKVNHELDSVSKNLGMSRGALAAWQGAVQALGGSAEGVTSFMSSLSGGISRYRVMGDTSLIQYFNTLGIGVEDAQGKVRQLDEIMLDLADSFSQLDRNTALTLAQGMGMDDQTFNVLLKGRKALQTHLLNQSKLYRSSDKDIVNTNKLITATAMLNQQFEALKLRIGNMIAPVLIKITDWVGKFIDKITKNEELIKNAITAISTVFSMLLVPAIWATVGAVLALTASVLPSMLLLGGLLAVIGLLYDDYDAWANGAASLFDWKEFNKWLKDSDFSFRNLGKSILYLLTGYKDWDTFIDSARGWLKLKGFMKDGKISLDSIKDGFKNLVKELLSTVMPVFERLGEVWDALFSWDSWKSGRTTKLLKALKDDFATWLGDVAENVSEAAIERVSGTVETARGRESPAPKGKFTGFGAEIDGYIKEASQKYIIDEKMLRGFIKMEDGWYGKMSPTGAIGTGQFTLGTWNELAQTKEGKEIGMTPITTGKNGNFRTDNDPRWNKRVNTLATALLAKKNASLLRIHGIEATGENLYMAHNIGVGALSRALKGKTTKDDIEAMKNNGMKSSETPLQFIARQKGIFNRHYRQANSVGIAEARETFEHNQHKYDVPLSSDEEKEAKKIQAPSKAELKEDLDRNKSPENEKSWSEKILWWVVDVLASTNQPLGNQVGVDALQASTNAISNMYNLAQPQNMQSNFKTEVAFNGGIHINSNANTLGGTAQDLILGVKDRITPMMFNNGVS